MAVSYEVTVDRHAPLVLRSRVLNRANAGRDGSSGGVANDPRIARRLGRRILEPELVDQDGQRLVFGYRTVASGMTLGLAVDHVLDVPCSNDVVVRADADASELVVSVDAEPDVPLRMVKYAAYQTSRSVDADALADRCRWGLDRAVGAGFESLLTAQRGCLDRILGTGGRHPRGQGPPPDPDAAGSALEPVPPRPGDMARRGRRDPRQGPDGRRLRRPLLLGHRDVGAAVPRLHPAAHRPQPPAVPPQHAGQGASSRGATGSARRAVPVAHDRRRRGVGLPPRRHRSVPPQRRHRLRHPSLRRRSRRHRLPRRDRGGDARRDGTDVGGPRLLRRGRLLPHPRRHRSRRVHGDGRRQRLHEPDGPPQPPLRGHGRPAAAIRAPRRVRQPAGRTDVGRLRARRMGSRRRPDVRAARPGARDHPPGCDVPHARALGPRRTCRRPAFPCSCTTTRSRCTAARC